MPPLVRLITALCLTLCPQVALAQSSRSSSTATSTVSDIGNPPAGCATTVPESFGLKFATDGNSKSARSLGRHFAGLRSDDASTHTNRRRADNIILTLTGGTLVGANGGIWGVGGNGQFFSHNNSETVQLYRGPFSICANQSLALGATTNWVACYDSSAGEWEAYYFGAPDDSSCQPCHLQESAQSATSSSSATSGTTTATPTSLAAVTPSSTTTTSGSATSPTGSPPAKPASHTGAIVGGVVGSLAGIALLAGVVAVFLLRRKRRQQRQEPMPPPPTGPAELHNRHTSELYGSDVPELYSRYSR